MRTGLRVAWAAMLLGAVSARAVGDLESQLREAMKVPAEYKVVYEGPDGAAMTAAQATELLTRGGELVPVRDDARKQMLIRVKNPPPPLKNLPDFDLQTLEGKRVRNADLAGKPTLLNFFFATCVPCIKEVPALEAFARKHPEFNYLAVTFDSLDEARSFVQQRKVTWPVLAGAKSFIDAAGVSGYPTYMLVAADGRVLGRGSGMAVDKLEDPKAMEAHFEQWVTATLK
jgi:peroxiredoxin